MGVVGVGELGATTFGRHVRPSAAQHWQSRPVPSVLDCTMASLLASRLCSGCAPVSVEPCQCRGSGWRAEAAAGIGRVGVDPFTLQAGEPCTGAGGGADQAV